MLSVCLITYNRANFLDPLLERLTREGMGGLSYEIVVCDNCSTDATQEVATAWAAKCPQIRYVRQPANVGSANNLLTAFRLARGRYAVYLADDDFLIPEAVAETVAFLESHPDVVACHAPWEFWDDVAKEGTGVFYPVPESRVYGRSELGELFNYIITQQVFPEICIYRTAVLHRLYLPPSRAYWAFVYLAQCFSFGRVAFRRRPFYRSVTVPSVPGVRVQAGHAQVSTELDSYRGGLELLAHTAFRGVGLPSIPDQQRPMVQAMIGAFIAARIVVALRLLIADRQFIAALQFVTRAQVNGMLSDADAAAQRARLAPHAVAEQIVELAAGISAREVLVCGVTGGDNAVEACRACSELIPVRAVSVAQVTGVPCAERTLVVTATAGDRAGIMASGVPSGWVVSMADLAHCLGLS